VIIVVPDLLFILTKNLISYSRLQCDLIRFIGTCDLAVVHFLGHPVLKPGRCFNRKSYSGEALQSRAAAGPIQLCGKMRLEYQKQRLEL